jgi:transcriptional regulator with XRE-family HTH domain
MKNREISKTPLTSGISGCIMAALRKLNKITKGGAAVDYSKLRGRIRERFSTQAAFASALCVSACALSQKLNGKSEWAADEIRKACELLDIEPGELQYYFFCPKS